MTSIKRRQEDQGKGYMVVVSDPNAVIMHDDRRRYVRSTAAIFYGDMERIRELCEIRYQGGVRPLNIDGEEQPDMIRIVDSGVSSAINTTVRLNDYEVSVEIQSEQHILVPYGFSQGFARLSHDLVKFIKEKAFCTDTDFGFETPKWWQLWKLPETLIRSRTYVSKSCLDRFMRFKRRDVQWFNIDNPPEYRGAVCHLWANPSITKQAETNKAV